MRGIWDTEGEERMVRSISDIHSNSCGVICTELNNEHTYYQYTRYVMCCTVRCRSTSGHVCVKVMGNQQPTGPSKQPIRPRYLGHVTDYQPKQGPVFPGPVLQ